MRQNLYKKYTQRAATKIVHKPIYSSTMGFEHIIFNISFTMKVDT